MFGVIRLVCYVHLLTEFKFYSVKKFQNMLYNTYNL